MKQSTRKKSLFLSEILWIGLFFFIDMSTKVLFEGLHSTIIQSIINRNASRGIPFPMGILIIVSLVAILLCFIAYAKKFLSYWSFVFLVSGALGNLFDRLVYGGVRDWINIKIIPVFNVADICITLGVCVFIFRERQKQLGKS